MDKYIYVLLILSLTLPTIFGENILVVFPHISYNHFKETLKLVTALETKGHNVTFVSPYEIEVNGYKNITQISIHGIVEPIERLRNEFFNAHNRPSCYWSKLVYEEEIGFEYSNRILNNKNVIDLIKSDSNFDLVLLEDVSADALAIFSHIFKCPLVVLLSEPLSTFYENYFSDDIQWKQLNEIRNAHHYVIKELYRRWIILPEQNKIVRGILPGAPDIQDVLYNTSLVFIPSYSTLSNLVPRYLNVKQIGGFHIDGTGQLPVYIQEFLNDSKEGVIVVSDDTDKTNLKLRQVLNLYGTSLQTMLWESNKYGGEILGHPNVKLFVGNGDIYETSYAIYNKVPVLSVGYNRWFQQFLLDTLVENGAALKIPINKIEFEYILDVAYELSINNTRYKENAEFASQIIRTKQLDSPTDEAVFWIEYVMKFHGASHLRPKDLHWQIKNHTIIITILIVITDLLLFILFYWIIKHILGNFYVLKNIPNAIRKIICKNSKENYSYVQFEK